MIPDTPSSAASGMGDGALLRALIEELRPYASRPLGSIRVDTDDIRKIVDGFDALSAKDRELAEARAHEANLIKRRDHYRECMESAGRELNAISAAIGTTQFMDPPDGGDVSLAEQVKRMRETLTTAERARDEALSALRACHRFLSNQTPNNDALLDTIDAVLARGGK